MNTKKPLESKNIDRILNSVFPSHFKLVSDKNSNGYKFFNLLYGVEFDEANNRMNNVYDDSFLDSFDTSRDYELYEIRISGVSNNEKLTGDGSIDVKITDEDEFYNGKPTRLKYMSSFVPSTWVENYSGDFHTYNSFASGFISGCWSNVSGIVGLEYIRSSHRGSGYFFIFSDIEQASGFLNQIYPNHRINVSPNFQPSGTTGSWNNKYGFFTGVQEQSYSRTGRQEILYPIDERTLSGQYPLHRQVTDNSGIVQTIDHYTPYHGWTRDENDNVVAVIDYSGEYYYDADGNKVYYRTAKNNPYGYGNYNIAYLDLEHTPISGTLKLYDIDILDVSGNATEIPSSGKILYYYKSSKFLTGSGVPYEHHDPVYVGYDSTVPSGYGFSNYMEGSGANVLKTVSWDYLHEGGELNEGSLTYIDGSGNITNRLKITNPYSRYLVEYKYKTHDKSLYISSLESNGKVSLNSPSPVYSTETPSGVYSEVDYEFTRDPSYGNKNSKILTFDGLKYRPNRQLDKIDFNIPFSYQKSNLYSNLYINTNKQYIGYSNEFVPQVDTRRNYYTTCLFDVAVSGTGTTEIDRSNNDYPFVAVVESGSSLYNLNFDTHISKKLIWNSGLCYYYNNDMNPMLNYTYFNWGFVIPRKRNIRFIELFDVNNSGYIIFDALSNGLYNIECNGYRFTTRHELSYNYKQKEIILTYNQDDVSNSSPVIELYFKQDGDFGYKPVTLFRSEVTTSNVSSNYCHIFKNCDINAGHFKIWHEVN